MSTTDVTQRPLRSATVTIALLAAALVAFQLLVLRVAAVRLQFHLDLLLVATSLLGVALAGSVLSMFERSWRLLPDAWVRRTCLGFLVSLPVAWAWLWLMPMPATLAFDGAGDWLRFCGFAAAGALPFAFGGGAIGLLLASQARGVHAVSGSQLLGAGAACALLPFLLWQVGAGGCFLATMVLAMAAAGAAGPLDAPARAGLMLLCACAGFLMPRFDSALPLDLRREVEIVPGQAVALGGPLWSRWSMGARVDVMPLEAPAVPPAAPAGEVQPAGPGSKPSVPTVPTGPTVTTAPTLPTAPTGPRTPLLQWWIAEDGAAGAVLRDYGADAAATAELLRSCAAAALQHKRGTAAKVCILGLGGGTDAEIARAGDAARIRVVEPNPGVIEAHRSVMARLARPLLDDPRIELVADDGRASLMRSDERYDVIQTTTSATWTSLQSGTSAFAPDYQFGVDAFRTMIDRLVDGGLLQVTATAAGAEVLRLLHNLWHALPEAERASFAATIAVLRPGADGAYTVLLRKGAFPPAEAARLRQFASAGGLDAVVLPDGDLRSDVNSQQARLRSVEEELARIDHEIGVRNEGVDDKELQRLRGERVRVEAPLPDLRARLRIAEFVIAADKAEFASNQPFDVSPTTDDRPFFHAFARRDATAAPALPGGDGGLQLLRVLTLFCIVCASVLLTLPLAVRGGVAGGSREGSLRFLLFFAGVAIGVVGLEVAIVQKFTLLLGQPLYSVAVTLASLFLFAGFGAFASLPVLNWEPERGRFVALGLFGASALVAFLSPSIVDLCIGLSATWRAAATALVTAPIGLLLGMPFAHGVRIVERTNPGLVPWAFAATACAGVVGALGTIQIAIVFGYSAVLFGAGLMFLVAFGAIDTLARSQPPVVEAAAETEAAPEN